MQVTLNHVLTISKAKPFVIQFQILLNFGKVCHFNAERQISIFEYEARKIEVYKGKLMNLW